MTTLSPKSVTIDHVGSYASTLCAFHCLIVAVAPFVFTVAGLDLLLAHEAEWIFAISAAALAVAAAVQAYRISGAPKIPVLFFVFASVLVGSRLLEEAGFGALGTSIGVGASLGLVATHVASIRACACCETTNS